LATLPANEATNTLSSPATTMLPSIVLCSAVLHPDLRLRARVAAELGVAVQRVAAKDVVVRTPGGGLEAAEHEAGLVVVVDDVVAHDDALGDGAAVLRSDLDPEVALGDGVVLDDDVAAAVDVDAAGEAAPVDGARADDRIAAHEAVARDETRVRLDVGLAADEVDPDVVDVAHDVIRHLEAGDVAVECQRLAPGRIAVVDLVAVDDEVRDRRGAGSVHRDAHGVLPADLVDDVVANLDVSARAEHAHSRAVVHAEIVHDLEALHAHVALRVDEDHVRARDAGSRRGPVVTVRPARRAASRNRRPRCRHA
jgi:hypothetical protein